MLRNSLVITRDYRMDIKKNNSIPLEIDNELFLGLIIKLFSVVNLRRS